MNPRGRIRLVAVLLLVAGLPLYGQLLGADWRLSLTGDHRLTDTRGEHEIATLERVVAALRVWQQAGAATLSWGLSGGIGYGPQQRTVSLDGAREVIPFLGETGVRILWGPLIQDMQLSAQVGRFALDDPTGLLLIDTDALVAGQLVDGIGATIRYPTLSATVQVGYLGLLDKDLNRIRLTSSDVADSVDPDQYFAPRRLVSVANVEVFDLLPQHNGGVMAVVQQDFRGNDAWSSYYLGPFATGLIAEGWTHKSALIGAYSRTDAEAAGFGLATEASGPALFLAEEVSFEAPWQPLETLWVRARWASSGNALALFPVLAGPAAGTVFREPLSDLLDFQLGAAASLDVPPRGAAVEPRLSVSLIFVPSGDERVTTGIAPEGSFGGIETNLGARYGVHDDFELNVEGALHFLERKARSAFVFKGRIDL